MIESYQKMNEDDGWNWFLGNQCRLALSVCWFTVKQYNTLVYIQTVQYPSVFSPWTDAAAGKPSESTIENA